MDDVILRQLWMKCLPANMATSLASNVSRSNLDELAEAADKIQELSDRSCIHEPDVLSKFVEKLELIVPKVSSKPGDVLVLRNNQAFLLKIEIKFAIIIRCMDMMPRNVNQAANTPKLTHSFLRETSPPGSKGDD
ncbi:unnamed protein product [Hymenolepis diminuta]|uniref:Uncharacterized protein n=1 Tax=Hymenolepis diminuta TaxID=6216 RepID=A0A564ZB73_HYMDI|nr:unnamed protein product [Hymenolepis diminuta]